MILVDTGPIVAAAVTSEVDHRVCVDLFTSLHLARRRLLLPTTVLSEVGHLLGRDLGLHAEARFLRALSAGDFELVNIVDQDVERMATLVEHYADSGLDTTDASVVAIAERLRITEIATLNRRDFAYVRPAHVDAFTLLPERIGPPS